VHTLPAGSLDQASTRPLASDSLTVGPAAIWDPPCNVPELGSAVSYSEVAFRRIFA
jgi:hypothetical protein